MNKIYFGDNLAILKTLKDESIDLIYIDPPFNTGKTQSRTRIRTIRDKNGDRNGFQGNKYKTIELGTKAYKDSFDFETEGLFPPEIVRAYKTIAPHSSIYFLEEFLRPRLIEAYRLLKPHGSLYFHIDYREVHYCKILLDQIFGRDCFRNEIIWAYDYGGRARSRWPAKHDNILYYVKDPRNYIFDSSKIDREDYMAPGLVGPEKATRGKLPTDTWWWSYIGKKGMKISDTWWMTIVGTNSKGRYGYPTQKPIGLINRIIQASSFPGQVVLDFFAGTGTVGESCIINNRNFILIDNNYQALEVMARRFSGFETIQWIGFDPTPFQYIKNTLLEERAKQNSEGTDEYSPEFKMLVTVSSNLQEEWEERSDQWKNSPFEWLVQLPARSKGSLARRLISDWLTKKGLIVNRAKDSSETLIINSSRFAIKFSTLWTNGIYKFQQIKTNGPEHIICFGISPFDVHCWIFDKEYAIKHGSQQHRGANGAEYWLSIDLSNVPAWVKGYGGTLDKAHQVINSIVQLKE